nr:MAG: internal scaffolding protein [Microvirus sp.]
MKLTIRKLGDRKRVRQELGPEESQVQQHLAADTDINNIMAKYRKTGVLQHVTNMAHEFGDFSDVPDYKSAMEQIMAADAMFMELPAAVRDRFGNDPAKFIEYATDKSNLDDLRKMGLAPAAPEAPEPPNSGGAGGAKGPDAKPDPKGDQ